MDILKKKKYLRKIVEILKTHYTLRRVSNMYYIKVLGYIKNSTTTSF